MRIVTTPKEIEHLLRKNIGSGRELQIKVNDKNPVIPAVVINGTIEKISQGIVFLSPKIQIRISAITELIAFE